MKSLAAIELEEPTVVTITTMKASFFEFHLTRVLIGRLESRLFSIREKRGRFVINEPTSSSKNYAQLVINILLISRASMKKPHPTSVCIQIA
jgi:hypothetical protein